MSHQHNKSLDLDERDFEELLKQATELVLNQFDNLASRKGFQNNSQTTIESWFDEPLPEHGIEASELLQLTKDTVLDTATGNLGPNFYGYIVSGGTQIGAIAELLAATINQNVAKWHLAPAIVEIEKRVIAWAAELTGFDPNAGGILVSGGSAANLTGLTVARNIMFEEQNIKENGLFNMPPFTIYASSETHSCFDKSLETLGIGTKHFRKIPVNKDFTINITELQEAIEKDIAAGFKPFCLVGNAGTVNTGAIDDLNKLAEIAEQHNMWYHIDGSYGGLACMLEPIKGLYAGIEKAHSIALDFHKWFYVPFEGGCTLVRDWSTLKRAYFKEAAYLDSSFEKNDNRIQFNEHYFQLSRNAKALKVWMTIKAYGMKKLRAMIQKDIDLAAYLSRRVHDSTDFILKGESYLAISCFQYKGNLQSPEDIEKFNQKLVPALEADGRVFITSTKLNGEFVLRACLINHRKNRESTDYLLDVIRDVAKSLQ